MFLQARLAAPAGLNLDAVGGGALRLQAAGGSYVGGILARMQAQSRVATWERRTEWPLTGVAAVFLAAYAWPILQPTVPQRLHLLCHVIDYATWAVFAADYVIRVAVARRRGQYVLRHLFDLIVVALPVFRPLRLLRLVLLLRVLNRRATESFRGRVVVYVCGSALILIFCAVLAVLDAERGRPGANIESFGDAVWWAVATVTTVGYGDRFPVTFEGRSVAVALMIGGIALLGVVTATVATWLIDRVRDVEGDAQYATRADLAQLTATIEALRAELTQQRATAPATGSGQR